MKLLRPLFFFLFIITFNASFSQTVMKQRLMATSLWHKDFSDNWSLVDSFGYLYSGNRGTFPVSDTGNIESISLYDSCYLAAGAPTDALGQASLSWKYDDNNRPTVGKSYNVNDSLIYERWNTFYSNDTLSSVTEIYYGILSHSISTYIKNYNQNGVLTRDSFNIQYPNSDPIFSIKNVNFDNLGRITTIDSFSQEYLGFRVTLTNYYNSPTSILPDSDSKFIVELYLNGTSDTLWHIMNGYKYYPSNLLKETINYFGNLSGFGDVSRPNYKNSYQYNNEGQITLLIDSTYSGSWWEQNRQLYAYTNGVNTSYIFYDGTGNESKKIISTLDSRNIVNTVKWYRNGVITDQDVYEVNEFKNRTKLTWTYYLQGLGSPTMGSISRYYYENNATTAIAQPKEIGNNLTIYPNPAKNTLKYRLNNISLNCKINVSITNIMGRVLYQGDNMNNSGEIDLSNLSAGNYIINIRDLEGKYSGSKKFVKESY